MKGVIKEIDLKKSMVYLETEQGTSVFEIISDDNFEEGDEVSWAEHNPFGDCKVFNITNGKFQDVYFQNH